MKKFDIHLHLTLNQLPKSEQRFISSAENMLPHLEKLGIGGGAILSGGEGAAPLMTNEECRAIAQKYPERYVWMCNLDEKEPETVYERLKACKEKGAVGIGEFMVNRPLNHPFIRSVLDAAEALELPVLFHMSPKEGYQYGVVDEAGLPLLEECLIRYPKLIFIGHSQPFWHEITGDAGNSLEERMEWGRGKVLPGGKVPYLFERYPNLYGDLSANSGGCAIMRDEKFGLEFLERYNTRLLYGTDMVNTDMTFPLGTWLDEKYAAGEIREEVYENICWRNAAKLFRLKGVNENAYKNFT